MSQLLSLFFILATVGLGVGALVWLSIAERRESRLVRDQIAALLPAHGLTVGGPTRMPLPANTALGGAFLFASGGGASYAFQVVPGYRGTPRRTLVARWVGDFPGVDIWGTSLPVLTVNPQGTLGWTYRAQVGKACWTGDPRFDERFLVHVTLKMGLSGPTMIEGQIPLRPWVMEAFLRLPPEGGFYFDGRLAVASFPGWGLSAAALAASLNLLEAWSRVAAEISAWRLSARGS